MNGFLSSNNKETFAVDRKKRNRYSVQGYLSIASQWVLITMTVLGNNTSKIAIVDG